MKKSFCYDILVETLGLPVRIDHNVAGLCVVWHPLPSIVPLFAAVKVLVEFFPGGSEDDQVTAPGVTSPAFPLAWPCNLI